MNNLPSARQDLAEKINDFFTIKKGGLVNRRIAMFIFFYQFPSSFLNFSFEKVKLFKLNQKYSWMLTFLNQTE